MGFEHHSPDEGSPDELVRLAKENRDPLRRLRYITRNQMDLERRLERVENSVVFRILRWIGGRLLPLASRIRPGLRGIRNSEVTGDPNYMNWVQETKLYQSCQRPSREMCPVSIVIAAHRPDRGRLERTISSIQSQSHSAWNLFVCTSAPPPIWLSACVAALPRSAGCVEVISCDDIHHSITSALQKTRNEYVALVDPEAILEPDALQCWLSFANNQTIVVYSDWDHVNAQGLYHTPRFTPEFSSELLLQTLYWGRCYLARTDAVRETGWPKPDAGMPFEHDLALRLAEQRGQIVRAAHVTWHLQNGTAGEEANAVAVRLALDRRNESASIEPRNQAALRVRRLPRPEQASVVICSRNPQRLERCLKSLQPTLSSHHELVVVAHQTDHGSALDRAAARYGAIVVPYHGAFHYGVMNQHGVAASHGKFILLLNDDIQPVTKDWLECMLAQLSRPDVGVVGALLLYPSGVIQHAGIVVGGRQWTAHAGRFEADSPYWPWLQMTREVSAVTGACFGLRRAVWDELSGFDPRFPVNFNDVDLCLRAVQRGYRVLVEAGAVLIHEESRTRLAAVRPEERELFYELWSEVIDRPDPFFNPQLATLDERIQLPEPWTRLR